MDSNAGSWIEFFSAGLILLVLAIFSVLENTLSRMTRVDIKLLLERRRQLSRDTLISRLARGKVPGADSPPFLPAAAPGWDWVWPSFFLSRNSDAALPLRPGIPAARRAGVHLSAHGPLVHGRSRTGAGFSEASSILSPFLFSQLPDIGPAHRPAGCRPGRSSQPNTDEDGEDISEEEVQAFLDVGEEEGIFEQEESKIIQQVVEFGDTIVREIMVPRTDMVAIRQDATMEALKDLMVKSRHSRIPVYRDRIDTIFGVAYMRQLLSRYDTQTQAQRHHGAGQARLFHPRDQAGVRAAAGDAEPGRTHVHRGG